MERVMGSRLRRDEIELYPAARRDLGFGLGYCPSTHFVFTRDIFEKMERVMGIEPTRPAWEAGVLPLNYTRKLEKFRVSSFRFQVRNSERGSADIWLLFF